MWEVKMGIYIHFMIMVIYFGRFKPEDRLNLHYLNHQMGLFM